MRRLSPVRRTRLHVWAGAVQTQSLWPQAVRWGNTDLFDDSLAWNDSVGREPPVERLSLEHFLAPSVPELQTSNVVLSQKEQVL